MKLSVTFSAILVAAASMSCDTQRHKPVAEVVKSVHALNGQTVTVAGYLAECAGYECRLYRDQAHAKQTQIWLQKSLTTRIRGELPPGDPLNAALGIGSGNSHEFDRKAAPFQHSYVLITGKVTNMCRDEDGKVGCTDRSTDLESMSIRAWDRSDGAAKNG